MAGLRAVERRFFRERTDVPWRGRAYAPEGELPMPAPGNPSFVVSRVVPSCQQVLSDGRHWPDRTDLACMWCEEAFDWPPVGAPVGHEPKKDRFLLKWQFCSFNCCKAWMLDRRMPQVSNIFWLAMRLYGRRAENRVLLEGIRPAPRKEALKKYGGWMDIAEFRANGRLVRPANPHGINVRWDPVQLAVQTDPNEQLACQSRQAHQVQRMPGAPAPSPQPRPAPPARPNTLDTFLRGAPKRKALPAKPVQPPKRVRPIK